MKCSWEDWSFGRSGKSGGGWFDKWTVFRLRERDSALPEAHEIHARVRGYVREAIPPGRRISELNVSP